MIFLSCIIKAKIPFVDEIVASVVTKVNKVGALGNTIMLFVSLPDNSESSLETDVRRTAFIYSPLLNLQQSVSNQILHVIDLLPTLVNATNLKWRTKDRIFIDGVNQWLALNSNDEERLDVYGDNFYISHYWKLSFGRNGTSSDFYGSIDNINLESDKDTSGYDFETYVKSVLSSDVHSVLDSLTSQKILQLKTRARVHCNLKDIGESAVRDIKCSRSSPCLFDLLEDPCEFDDKHEPEFNVRRDHMTEILRRYLNGEKIDGNTVKSSGAGTTAEDGMEDGMMVGVILGGTIFGCIFIFIVVVCFKEKCNRKRSVYRDKAKDKAEKNRRKAESESSNIGEPSAIATVSNKNFY